MPPLVSWIPKKYSAVAYSSHYIPCLLIVIINAKNGGAHPSALAMQKNVLVGSFPSKSIQRKYGASFCSCELWIKQAYQCHADWIMQINIGLDHEFRHCKANAFLAIPHNLGPNIPYAKQDQTGPIDIVNFEYSQCKTTFSLSF